MSDFFSVTRMSIPGNIHFSQSVSQICDIQKQDNNLKTTYDFSQCRNRKIDTDHQRANVVIRLAHISKKSMVWLPRRGETEDKVLPVREPVREPDSEWLSVVVESKLDLGLCKPAAEPERCGVEEPDLCSTTSSSILLKSKR